MHFRRGPPTIFRKHMPSGMGTESLGTISMYIRGEWALRRWAYDASFSKVPVGVLRVISGGFITPTRAFSKGAPHHFPKAHALRYGHRKLWGLIRMYNFAENAALRRWRWIKPTSGTGWGAKGDLKYVIFTYTAYIFESRTHHLFQTAHALSYTHSKVGNDQNAYSWRNDIWKVNFKRVCKKPTRVLMVIWSGFLAHTRAFSKGAPHHESESTCPEV